MVRWHHQFDGHAFEHTQGDSGGWCATVHKVAAT